MISLNKSAIQGNKNGCIKLNRKNLNASTKKPVMLKLMLKFVV